MLQPVSLKSREPQVSQGQNQSVSRAESHSVGTRGECTSRHVQAVGRIRLHELLGLRSSFSCCVSRGLPLALGLAHGPLHLKTSNQALFTLPPHVCLFSCLSSYLPSVLSFSYICTVEFPSGCHDTVLFQ